MKRILLVDDDPQVFEGLQRMLAPQNGQWEMSFAPEGEAALLLMAATPFDVVVSDLRMPKMDGPALLKTVRERWPGVVRIVLSGKADMGDALRAVPVAHQCLLKPCDPMMLRSAIERATSLSELLNNKLLAGIVGSVQDLPVMPRAYLELRDTLANPNYSLKKIVHIVEQDVGISSKILQLVNSAFFGLPKDVSSIHMAVCYIGAEMLQNRARGNDRLPLRLCIPRCRTSLRGRASQTASAPRFPLPRHCVSAGFCLRTLAGREQYRGGNSRFSDSEQRDQ